MYCTSLVANELSTRYFLSPEI